MKVLLPWKIRISYGIRSPTAIEQQLWMTFCHRSELCIVTLCKRHHNYILSPVRTERFKRTFVNFCCLECLIKTFIIIIIIIIIVIIIITMTGGMADKCLRYHSRLAELLSAKKQESYATTISWVRAKVSFAILRSTLLCLRVSRTPRRRNLDVKDRDLEIEKGQAGLP